MRQTVDRSVANQSVQENILYNHNSVKITSNVKLIRIKTDTWYDSRIITTVISRISLFKFPVGSMNLLMRVWPWKLSRFNY